ncbi:MAG: nucleotidyltransferase domain-containing protein [Sciscionella sp.]
MTSEVVGNRPLGAGSGHLAPSTMTAVRRCVVRAARTIYTDIARSRFAPMLNSRILRAIKARVTYMPAARVLSVLEVFEQADLACWVAGGWGVDALVGCQTRRHYDLDIVIGNGDEERRAVGELLTRQGFRAGDVEPNDGFATPLRCAWHHDDGHVIEILPVALHEPPFSWAPVNPVVAGVEAPFTRGHIEGREVNCLSAALQLRLHRGYPLRDIDQQDMKLLRALTHVDGVRHDAP